MLLLITKKAAKEDLEKAGKDLDGYIKFVIDLASGDLTIGGERHVDGERELLENGSNQKDLWGGGYDSRTEAIDFDSMINIRPKDNNFSREVMNIDVREKIKLILKEKLNW